MTAARPGRTASWVMLAAPVPTEPGLQQPGQADTALAPRSHRPNPVRRADQAVTDQRPTRWPTVTTSVALTLSVQPSAQAHGHSACN
jgi:hypothetical protein